MKYCQVTVLHALVTVAAGGEACVWDSNKRVLKQQA
jgi:hypothetical protein